MQIYVLIACDRLEEKQENDLKQNLAKIMIELEQYINSNPDVQISLINDCTSLDCEDWQLGITQSVKKSIQLKFPIKLFNDLAKTFSLDCEVGSIENEKRIPVSYFGKNEGNGDSFLIAQYLGL